MLDSMTKDGGPAVDVSGSTVKVELAGDRKTAV